MQRKKFNDGNTLFNVTGMLPFEEKVSDYIKNTNTMFSMKPFLFIRMMNLLQRGLVLQAASIEDEEIRFRVYIYNVQPEITI